MKKANTFGFGISKSTLPNREIYAQAAGIQGRNPPRLVWQLGRSKKVRDATKELDHLFREIFPEACEADPTKVTRLVAPRVKNSGQNKAQYERKKIANSS